jgi:hypothetical protein
MAKRGKEGGGRGAGRARLELLLAAGDLRGARAEATRQLADPAAGDADQELARTALARSSPERGAAIALAVGLAFYLTVALAGLLHNR